MHTDLNVHGEMNLEFLDKVEEHEKMDYLDTDALTTLRKIC